jgi:hypothetical protein
MAVNVATRGANTRQSAAVGLSQSKYTAWGTIEVTSNPAPADTFVMCKLPKGAMIVGGRLMGDKLDSTGSGSACLTINIGVDKAITLLGTGTAVTSSSTSNALGASWALGPDAAAVTGYKPETGRNQPLGGLLITDGPFVTSDECNAYIIVGTSAAGITTGTLTLFVDYYMSTHA